MPSPAPIYILAAVGTIAAGLAFKEFVYDPYIAPQFERWRQEIIARNQARRAGPVSHSTTHGGDSDSDSDDGHNVKYFGQGRAVELEDMKEVRRDIYQWRSRTRSASGAGVRLRTNAAGSSNTNTNPNRSPLDEFNDFIAPAPPTPSRPPQEDPAASALRWSSVTGSSFTLDADSTSSHTIWADPEYEVPMVAPTPTLPRRAPSQRSRTSTNASARASIRSDYRDLPATTGQQNGTTRSPVALSPRSPSFSASASMVSFDTALSQFDMPSASASQTRIRSPFSDNLSYVAPNREDMMSPFSIAASDVTDVETLSSGTSAFGDDDRFSTISGDELMSQVGNNAGRLVNGSPDRFSDVESEASWEDIEASFSDAHSVASPRR